MQYFAFHGDPCCVYEAKWHYPCVPALVNETVKIYSVNSAAIKTSCAHASCAETYAEELVSLLNEDPAQRCTIDVTESVRSLLSHSFVSD
jgi:hypothetical protein